MILVDTSLWIDHFRRGNPRLRKLLEEGVVLCHAHVIGELACGNLHNRSEILSLLSSMPQARQASDSEVVHFIETSQLYGKGLGWVDMHLLASALLTQVNLWTLDKRLKGITEPLNISAWTFVTAFATTAGSRWSCALLTFFHR